MAPRVNLYLIGILIKRFHKPKDTLRKPQTLLIFNIIKKEVISLTVQSNDLLKLSNIIVCIQNVNANCVILFMSLQEKHKKYGSRRAPDSASQPRSRLETFSLCSIKNAITHNARRRNVGQLPSKPSTRRILSQCLVFKVIENRYLSLLRDLRTKNALLYFVHHRFFKSAGEERLAHA